MGTLFASELAASIDLVRNNPSAIQRVILNGLDAAHDGTLDIVDATNPFIFLLESACVLGATAMENNLIASRDQYPSLALNQQQVYKWMSDRDYVNRFATPTQATFILLLDKAEVIAKAVPTGDNGVSRLTIPRNTVIAVAGHEFTMQYPVDIRILEHGGLQVTYDASRPSPLQSLASNIVPVTTLPFSNVEYLALTLDVLQMSLTSNVGKVNLATGFSKSYAISNYFYYARVYASDSKGAFKEVTVSYDGQVFDPTIPTVLVTVYDKSVTVSVPHVYLTNGAIANEVRVDLYTTEGPLSLIMSNYKTEEYSAKWQDFDNDFAGVYYAPLNNFTNKGINSTSIVTGGSGPMTFEQLRQRVIANAMGDINRPITNVEFDTRLSDMGYGMVTDVDNITNRMILATRALPPPTDGSVTTGAGCTINMFQTTLDALSQFATVKDNGARMTLLPSTLYQNDNGIISIVQQSVIDGIRALTPDLQAQRINSYDFVYSPLHYVLDTTNEVFEARAYYLDDPAVKVKAFVTENASTDIAVATGTYALVRTATGYQLQVVVNSSDTYKAIPDGQCFAQLAYIPIGETNYAYLNGTLVGSLGGERVFGFNLDSNFDIDARDELSLTSFSMYNEGPRVHRTSLTTSFQMLYGVTNYAVMGQTSSSIDALLGTTLLAANPVGVTQEVFEMTLGYALTGLWNNTRTVVSPGGFATHTADVPLLYPNDVYLLDPITGVASFTTDQVTGAPVFTILHHAGDPVLDTHGNPTYQYRIGDPVVDTQGMPVQLLPRSMARQIDMLMIDGAYWWATEAKAVAYRNYIPTLISAWVDEDIAALQKLVLEQTEVYYYPKSTVGLVQVTTQSGIVTTISSEQSFRVTYYLSQNGYGNASFMATLRSQTMKLLAQLLDAATVAKDDIVAALKSAAGSDVISLDFQGLGGSLNLTALKMQDASMRLTIGKVVTPMADGTLGVDDDVEINFLPFF